jgi:hypothetical protein
VTTTAVSPTVVATQSPDLDFGGETEIALGWTLEDPLLLEPVLIGVGIEPERYLAQPVGGPRHTLDRFGAML